MTEQITYNEVLYYEVASASFIKSMIWAWVLPNWMVRKIVTNKMNRYNRDNARLISYAKYTGLQQHPTN